MILLDKFIYSLRSGLALLLIPFFFACEDPNDLGLELDPDEDKTNTLKATFTLPSSTIYIDSLRTDQFSFIAFGQYEDSIYGQTRAIGYNQYNIAGGTLPTKDTIRYSSANLILKVREVRSKGSLFDQEINIHEVNDTIHAQVVYLSNRYLPYDDTPLVTHQFDFDPAEDSIINIPLPDEFGENMFRMLQRAESDQESRDSLTQGLFRYDPFAFVPGANNSGLFTFDMFADTVAIYINMENDSSETFNYQFDFRDTHYTEVTRNRGSGKLSDLTEEYVESSVMSGRTYLDPISGIHTKIDLTPLTEFIESQNDIIINKGDLRLGAVDFSDVDFLDPVQSLQYFFIGENGRINGAGVVDGNSFRNALLSEASYRSPAQGTSLETTVYDSTNVNYETEMTLFTQILYDNFAASEDYIAEEMVITTQDLLGLDQTSLKKSEITLTLYYTTITE